MLIIEMIKKKVVHNIHLDQSILLQMHVLNIYSLLFKLFEVSKIFFNAFERSLLCLPRLYLIKNGVNM